MRWINSNKAVICNRKGLANEADAKTSCNHCSSLSQSFHQHLVTRKAGVKQAAQYCYMSYTAMAFCLFETPGSIIANGP